MDGLFYGVATVIAVGLLVLIMDPLAFLPNKSARNKKVGCTYWGVYQDVPTDTHPELKTIELRQPSRHTKVLGGHETYAAGKTIKMNK